MENTENLKKELDDKIKNHFKDNQAYFEYILQTKKNFIHRYLETSNKENVIIQNLDEKTLVAESFESNMGDAFKISNHEIKNGIKFLAKSIPREKNPTIKYSLKTILNQINENHGKITLIATVDWDFPLFSLEEGKHKSKQVIFDYKDPNVFRKELALKYEEVCDLFI
jgi:hypothetical protein